MQLSLAALSPQEKLDALKEMGFTAMWEEHQPDCYSFNGDRCICIPPGTSWMPPKDVREYMHETYEELRNRKERNRAS